MTTNTDIETIKTAERSELIPSACAVGWVAPLPEPIYNEDGITLYCADCTRVLPLLEPTAVDLVLTDPPYGISVAEMNCASNRNDGRSKVVEEWDTKTYGNIMAIKNAGKNYVIWGGNYYNCFGMNGGAIIWDKLQPLEDSSQCEIAAISKYRKVFKYTERWTNFVNSKESEHPTEKPIKLMQFCISIFDPQTILDPFAGSGTTLVAAKRLGRKAIGIEISEKYCRIAIDRLRQRELF
jgi:DNA modification methylase